MTDPLSRCAMTGTRWRFALAKRQRVPLLTLLIVVGVVVLAGCAGNGSPKPADPSTANPSAVDSSTVDSSASALAGAGWSPQSNCEACHDAQAMSWSSPASASSSHTAQACVACHTNEAVLQKAHEGNPGVAMPKRLSRDAEVTNAACQSCHNLAEVAQKTARLTLLTDEEGTTVNPHELPAKHLGVKLNCASCHSVHRQAQLETSAKAQCATCHHENVYQCGTCHELP